MSEQEDTPRQRRIEREEPPEMPSGWRSSKRGSKAFKKAQRELKAHGRREAITASVRRAKRGTRNVTYLVGMSIAIVAGVLLALVLVATLINGVARWNAQRAADEENSPAAMAEKAKDNLLVIAETEGDASGFLAIRWDAEQEQVYGIAIPDGAFIEVPGQGFEKIGDSYKSGADVSMAAVTNFFGVPFNTYVVVDTEVYQNTLTSQSLVGVVAARSDTNLSESDVDGWSKTLDETPSGNVALVPMPVKPLSLGSQTYFEPQREEINDLVEQWWGVTISGDDSIVRVIIYNGSGVPGIAGEAAQELIHAGYRVVDTKNADRFDYEVSQIVVQNGTQQTGDEIKAVLGMGDVVVQPADQQIADVILIVGSDFTGSGSSDDADEPSPDSDSEE